MRFICKAVQKPELEDWHLKFHWLPVRMDDYTIVWLETTLRRMVVDDEGNWAGGFMYHWEYKPLDAPH